MVTGDVNGIEFVDLDELSEAAALAWIGKPPASK